VITTQSNIVKSISTSFVVGLVITLSILIIKVLSGEDFVLNEASIQAQLKNFLVGFVLTLLNSTYVDYLYGIQNWPEGKQHWRIILAFVGCIPLTMFGLWLSQFILQVLIGNDSFSDFNSKQKLQNYVGSIVITLIVLLVYHTVNLYKRLQENRVKEHKIIAGNASAKFESLKNQIDPHFLFNSLNVLSSLIEENPDNAQKFTTSLSKVYRYVLEQKDKELVTLSEELDFAKVYMKLLGMRFENSLTYDLPQNLTSDQSKVVPLSLQLLLENTIKHNIVSDIHPLHISIYQEGDFLVVSNNLQKKQVLQTNQGVGLKNIIYRYEILTDQKVIIDQNEKDFKVKIPILTNDIEFLKSSKNSEMDAYLRAKKQVQSMKEFYTSLSSYLIVIPFLIFVNYRGSWDLKWFLLPAVGWGLGLVFLGYSAFGDGSTWEDKKVRQIIEKAKNKNFKT
jgi:two-component system, LytTR family, sensor kinase